MIFRNFVKTAFGVALIATVLLCGTANAGNIDTTDKYAWGSNIGWLNFNPSDGGGVTVYDDHLEGYVWAENIGWIRLGTHTAGGPHTYTNADQNTYGVNNDGSGNLSGYGWSTNAGWIRFNPSNGGVTVDSSTGDFDGYAWGENIGWIHFSGTAGDFSVYKVTMTASASGTNAAQMLFTQVVSEAAPGSKIRLTAYIKNTGEAAFTPDVFVRFYVDGFAAGDSQCVSILPDRYLWVYYQGVVPADASGSFNITAQVFDAGGAISGVSTASVLTVPSAVHTVDILRVWPVPSTSAGGRVLLKVLVKNSGTTALAAGTHVDFYMDGPDYGTPTSVGTVTAAGLAAGACRWYYMYWPVPTDITGGTYTLSAQVKDSGGTPVSDVSTGFSFAVSGS
jgi:hypothetical protein